MKVHQILLGCLVAACMSLLMGCDSSGGGGSGSGSPDVPDPTADPDPYIMPYKSPPEKNPIEDPDNGDGGGTDAGNGGNKDDGSSTGEDPVPEPSTLVLVGSGVAIITLCRRKKKGQKNI